MPIAVRHRSDAPPSVSALPGLDVHRELDPAVLSRLQSRDLSEIEARFAGGHRAYIARVHGAPAAWGWVATSSARIGELNASFALSPADRYLWNFVTLAAFRGRGIYPRLLAAIVAAESADAERFWVAWAPENHASGAGIRKAGFTAVAELSFDLAGQPVVRDIEHGGARMVAQLLGLPAIAGAVAACWKCARTSGPAQSACATGMCSCDYQLADKPCIEAAV